SRLPASSVFGPTQLFFVSDAEQGRRTTSVCGYGSTKKRNQASSGASQPQPRSPARVTSAWNSEKNSSGLVSRDQVRKPLLAAVGAASPPRGSLPSKC